MQKVDLLEGSIVRSLTSLALPIMATSLIQMAYNMTDMIWIGRVSSQCGGGGGRRGNVSVASQRPCHDPRAWAGRSKWRMSWARKI